MTRDELIASLEPGDRVILKPATVYAVGPAGGFTIETRSFTADDIDRIEKAPRPLKVGDRVRKWLTSNTGRIVAIDGDQAAVVWDIAGRSWPLLTDLVRIDPEPGQ